MLASQRTQQSHQISNTQCFNKSNRLAGLTHDTDKFEPIIQELYYHLEETHPQALTEAVRIALGTRAKPLLCARGVDSALGFLTYANGLLRWIPVESHDGKAIYEDLCVFYFVLDQPVLHKLQTRMHPDSCGKPLTWLSSWMVRFAQQVGVFHDSIDSITPAVIASFVNAPKFRMDECVVPDGGFHSFNQLFARRLKPETRPIASPGDPSVVTYMTDCTFKVAAQIDDEAVVTLKGLPWKIADLVQDTGLGNAFTGGIWMHGFLNTHDYHRQHAPVSGRVIEAKIVSGTAYFNVIESSCSSGLEVGVGGNSHGIDSPLECDDSPGHQFLQSRGVIVIDSPAVGLVAVLPIGMAHVASVRLSVKKGDFVEKGQELAYFQFGGSDCVAMFSVKAGLGVEDFPSEPTHYLMGEEMVRVRSRLNQ